ncbi:LITAF-like zinc ribbon domain-containing protein [Fennellomyces sp. T-0311]|nr:LITAF-like zinc ribbon domain-containing protein [Fennellomyces sp. T-0311]
MNEQHAKRRYLLPDRLVSSVVQRYKYRRRKRADSGHQTMQAERQSARSLSYDDNNSLRSAYSGMTPQTSASLAAESGMSVRLGHYHVGTPVSYRLTTTSTTSTSSIESSRRASFFSRQRRQGSSNPSIANSWRIRRTIEDQPLPDFETQVFCPTCEKWVQSRIRYRLGALTWLVAFILFACTVFLFWVPFYVKYFKDVVHYCPACGTNIGRHSKL